MRIFEIIKEDNVIKFPSKEKPETNTDDLSDLEKLKKDKRHLDVTRGDDGFDRDEDGGYSDGKSYYPDPNDKEDRWIRSTNPFPKKMMARWNEYFDTLNWDDIVADIKNIHDTTSPDRKDVTYGDEYKGIPFKVDDRSTGFLQRHTAEFEKRYGKSWRDYANDLYHSDMEVPFDEREMSGSFWLDRDDGFERDLTPLTDQQKYKKAITLTKLKKRGVEKNYKNASVIVGTTSDILAELITTNKSFIAYERERMKEKSNFNDNGWYYSFGMEEKYGSPMLYGFDTEESFQLLLSIIKDNNLDFISIPSQKKKIQNDKFVDDDLEGDDVFTSMVNQED